MQKKQHYSSMHVEIVLNAKNRCWLAVFLSSSLFFYDIAHTPPIRYIFQ